MLFSQSLFGQKIIRKSYPAPFGTLIQVDTDKSFQAEIMAYDGTDLIVEARLDGEYADALSVNITKEGSTLWVATEFDPAFEVPNDKLSAHKVVSVSLNIQIPTNLDVQVFGNSCNVTMSGAFNNVDVVLNDGNCTLNQVAQRVNVQTQSGNIVLNSLQGVVRAVSHYGQLIQDEIPKGEMHYDLETVTGDITLYRTK
ncbi:DUF4097 family beta strand repeat-containing protein [Poritiphilus sp. M415]|uniref:DUF4097 family beta strand repeat-containing protein n=1 Tax=Lentiprolixibacter aurantiacus TaxID=2993939 RepID=A0AAE3MIB7_9FLAO|nr:DUF4097 family beta strand repeat-containing protein [Lentiprolixibacter aurantiacus]